MKKIAVITNFSTVAELHKKVLKDLFLDVINVDTYSFDNDPITHIIEADVLLISLYSIYVEIKKYIPANAKVIILATTITQEQYEKIIKIPPTSQILLVNYSPEMTMETLSLFRQIGLTQYDFIPVYPGKKNIPQLDIALTPGERDKVPSFVKQIIDIGHRTLDISTLSDVAIKIDREDLLRSDRFLNHFKKLKKASSSISTLLDRATILESRFFELLNVIDEGIIATDVNGIIFALNKKASEIFKLNPKNIGTNVLSVIRHPSIKKAIEKKVLIDQELININDNYISFQVVPVKTAGDITGFLMIANIFEEKERSQHKLRTKLLSKGHKARYTFESIIGVSDIIEDTKNMAKRMARSNSSILITGESGVGKELFAQAIHNASNRKNYQFVAINCAAIPDNLLESELFGYEEGAFTGAKKGGKMGMFEIAHNGTLFLDEIGEMPLQLQSRLLRVIQEREVMRIGGENIIHVNIRIIAATNKNLKQLVKEGKFRSDLYYRLNVLPLAIPPLRERGNDVLVLFEHIREQIGATYRLSDKSKNFLLRYNWEGNLRELRNCIEYLAYLEKETIEVNDLNKFLTSNDNTDYNMTNNLENVNLMDCRTFILKCLYDSRKELKGIGRRNILDKAREAGVFITESDVRKTLDDLSNKGLVRIQKGRAGTSLTSEGLKEVLEIKK
jgi:transcriptional regulator with PAS, ATPase and Fis domain